MEVLLLRVRPLGGSRVAKRMSERAPTADGCVFCDIARRAHTSTTSLLYADDKVVAFRDINPSVFRHYLVVPIEHTPTVKSLQRTEDDHRLDGESHGEGGERLA